MKKLSLVFAMVLVAFQFAAAQRTITGTVTDAASGTALISANVLVEGTAVGTVTDVEGKYSIEVPEGASVLVFSYIGYTQQRITLSAADVVDVSLAEGVTVNDVVVTALGVKREKKSLGYATQEVSGEEVTKVKDANFINSLSGKVAGVQIKRSNQMGGSANIVVRGYKSITGNNQALFVVDGVPISNSNTNTGDQTSGRGGFDFGNAAMDINPEDIASINVLKGAAATALYGSRAANGVVLITTKKGTRKKGLGVSVSTGVTVGNVDKSTLPRYQKQYGPGYSVYQGWYAQDGFDFYDFGNGAELTAAVYEDASYGPAFDPNIMAYDWRSYFPELSSYGQLFPYVAAEDDATSFFETATTYNTNVSIDGGSDRGSYRLSFTNFDQGGILPNSNIKRNTINFGSSYDITDDLRVSSSVNYIVSEGTGRYGTGYDNRNPNQSFRQWYNTGTSMSAQREAYEQTGKNISWNPYASLDPARATQPHYFDNYYFNRFENFTTDGRNRMYGNIQLDYALSDALSITGRVSTDRYDEIQEERIAVGSVDVSKYERYNRSFYENNFDLYLNYNEYFGEGDKLNVSALAGTNIRRSNVTSIRAATNGGLVVPGLYALSNSVSAIEAPSEYVANIGVDGYYARASFGYDQFLYLDLAGRYDISSTLPAGNNSYFYPSASLSFVFSEMLDMPALSFGKFRLNYAEVGNDAIPLSTYDTYLLGTPFNGTSLASAPSRQNNGELRPERTKSFELGLELNFFNNRLGLDASVYRSNTYDQILPATVTGATGRLSQVVNAGNVQNQGVEIALNYTPIKTKDLRWDINLNWAKNVNTVIELFGDQTNLQLSSFQGGVTLNATKGEPFGAIWGTDFVRHTDGSPIVYPHWNGGVRYQKTTAPSAIGNITPDWIGGINNRISYQDFTLSFLIDAQMGGQFFSLDTWYGYATGLYDFSAGNNENGNPVRALPADGGGLFIDGTVVQTGTDADGNPISDGTPNTEAFYAADVYNSLGYVYAPNALHVYDATFVKLRELSLTYSLPRAIVGKTPFQALDFSLVGRNLWIIYKASPYSDPESGLSAGNFQGYQSGAYPAVKEVGFSLNAKF